MAQGRSSRAILWAVCGVAVLGLGLVGFAVWSLIASTEQAGVRAVGAAQELTEATSEEPAPVPQSTGIADLASSSWLAETSATTRIPQRALAAYAGAEITLQSEQPACGIDWTTLAGIGYVESLHGTLNGGAIDADGWQVPTIQGIALDGTSTDAIPDTDGGALDGDAQWDRAVGPMQIIPETWSRFGADGNDDGKQDPQQIDDAALAAARYLCADGFDLNTADGWIAAVAAYNNTVDYNLLVVDATNRYRSL